VFNNIDENTKIAKKGKNYFPEDTKQATESDSDMTQISELLNRKIKIIMINIRSLNGKVKNN
jgi:hypothetical protein